MFSSSLLFLDIGGGELMLIFFVALLLFGGKKLPELARGLGKGIRDFKDASEGVKREINSQIDTFQAKKAEEEAKTATTAAPVVVSEEPLVEAPQDPTIPAAGIVNPIPGTMPAHTGHTAANEPVHMRETPIEPVKTEHEEYKS
jgi:sec-independent protein translocase protein TatA